MKATDDDLREALRRASGRNAHGRAGCPPPEVIAHAAEGAPEAPPADIADHVAGCPDCAFEFRLASALKPWAEGASATLSRPVEQASRRSRVLPLALAASLAMCLGLVGWVLSLRQQGHRLEARLADAEQSLHSAPSAVPAEPAGPGTAAGTAGEPAGMPVEPYANIPLVDLFPRDAARGGAAAPATVDPSRSPFVVLILNVRQPDPGATYGVELVDGSGAPLWTTDGIRAGAEPITLGIPSRLLSSDRYRIRLHRVRAGGRIPVEQYDLAVERAQP
jgi:hypothetical protein